MDYPVVESIKSLLPLVDEMIVGVGQSEDGTRELIASIGDSKIKIFDSYWDTNKTQGGLILSEKTNEALAHCANDWCVYLQGDEVLHEADLNSLRQNLIKYENDKQVQGLLFKYLHFYGSYEVIATSRNWYRSEIRAIKKHTGIQSVGDAQGFRVNAQKAYVRDSGARVFHYGWVKPPENMRTKKKLLDRWWHGTKKDEENKNFEFKKSYGLRKFKGAHPQVMATRIIKQGWTFSHKMSLNDWNLTNLNYFASDVFERVFKFRIGEYKNYRLLK